MRKGLLALFLGATLSVASFAAEAMPAGAGAGTGAAPEVILVAGGCGIGFHRGPYGGCRPNGYFRRYGYAYGYGRPFYRGYGPGWHRGWRRW
jgi:hypothetical protein